MGKMVFNRKWSPIGYLITNGQPPNHVAIGNIIQAEYVVFMYLEG